MKAEILSVGTELLLGEIVDTNASYLASQLPLLGIDLYWISVVGDNRSRLTEALKRAWERSELILITGGLGPTQDDITREAIADLFNEELIIDLSLLAKLQELFKRYGVDMPPSNIKQASLIASSKAIPNQRGTAPGWWVERENRLLIAMPGPPGEMQTMWEKEIFPRLQQRTTGFIILSKALKTFGLAEAKVDEMVSSFLTSQNPTLAVYAKPDGIHLRITAKTPTSEEAREIIGRIEAEIRKILGDYIWGEDNDTLENVTGNLLATKGFSLAIMEGATAGLLANTVANAIGSHTYFKGGLVAYTSEAKIAFGIDPQLIKKYGAVSLEVTEAMAATARHRFAASIGVGITGAIGPNGNGGKPIGTVFIVVDDGKVRQNFVANYPGQPYQIKLRAVTAALFELRKFLLREG